MPSFSPNLPVTAACKFQTLSIHICHPPCHQHLTHRSLGFQIWPGITLKQPSMIDSSCIYNIFQREEKTRRFAVATAEEFYVKNCGLQELFWLVQGTKIQVIPNTDKPQGILWPFWVLYFGIWLFHFLASSTLTGVVWNGGWVVIIKKEVGEKWTVWSLHLCYPLPRLYFLFSVL
jgi:hypothetical protein